MAANLCWRCGRQIPPVNADQETCLLCHDKLAVVAAEQAAAEARLDEAEAIRTHAATQRWVRGGYRGPAPEQGPRAKASLAAFAAENPTEFALIQARAEREADQVMVDAHAEAARYAGPIGLGRRVRAGFRAWRHRRP